ncbi:helix-turn-helix domain-containing protein [Sphingobium xenophagum]|uniref:helix-turn-helix domain-containing protein n=1 Tax=Sphingobium xenophagum TaxID=121428 RepID=UPI0036D2860B|tara:strand:- start:7189 stop:7389 length:201 start_codon:yes stop_codon:yes gene_type:complete
MEDTMSIDPLALQPKAAFAAIGVGVTKGYELINAGELTAFKVGRATRITTDSLKAFVAKRVAEAAV